MQVHIVETCPEYDAGQIVKIFADQQAANVFRDLCEAHSDQKPDCPPIENTPENDALWDHYRANEKLWAESHPAGTNLAFNDSWRVSTYDVIGAP